MRFKEFQEITLEAWSSYLRNVHRGFATGDMILRGAKALFPDTILMTETNDHFIYELFGLARRFEELQVKFHREVSTSKYLYQFNTVNKGSSLVVLEPFTLENVLLARKYDHIAVTERFGFHYPDIWGSKIIFSSGTGSAIKFQKGFKLINLKNCILINSLNETYRIKQILYMAIVEKNLSKQEYKVRLKEMFLSELNSYINQPARIIQLNGGNKLGSPFCGVYIGDHQLMEDISLASQFANLFLIPGLRETTIGKFIKNNPRFIKKALSYKEFQYELELDWIEGNPDPNEKSIRFDLLFQREDGFFDVCDLKRPELDKKRITNEKHRRRGFISVVERGFNQLANYREYFDFKKNAELAYSKYGVKILDPELILIVGNYENTPENEIREAFRKYRDTKFKIIDYDTLHSLFFNSILKEES